MVDVGARVRGVTVIRKNKNKILLETISIIFYLFVYLFNYLFICLFV